jgi:hypothetical protein
MVISHLRFKAFYSQMPHIQKKTTSKTPWSQDQLKAALAAAESGRKQELVNHLIFTRLLLENS